MAIRRSNQPKEPAWDRLYKKGLVVAAQQQIAHEDAKKQETIRKIEATDVVMECTFHPRINLTSSSVAEGWQSENAFDRLYKLGQVQQDRQLQRQIEKEEEEMRRLVEEKRQILRDTHPDESHLSPHRSSQNLEVLFSRLAKPHGNIKTYSKRNIEAHSKSQTHSFTPRLAAATNRLYENSKRRKEAQVQKEKEEEAIQKEFEDQAMKAKQIIRERGGPTCVSGNPNCDCPEHHHNNKETKSASDQNRSRRLVRHVSDHLLVIPAHRLSEQHVDPHRSLSGNWPADSPYFAHLAPREQKAPLQEPSNDRLTLEDLARHELMMRARDGNVA